MKVEGTYTFKADQSSVWEAMQSPEILAACLTGCESFNEVAPDTYEVVLKVKVAAVSGTYTGRVTIEDRIPPDSYKMVVEGKGRAGTVRGEGTLNFSVADGETLVHVFGDAQVSGIIARVGQRLMGSASKMLMNQFFSCLKSKIEVEQGTAESSD